MTKEQYDMLRQKGGYDAMYIDLLNASGFAGCLPNGNIVDRRYHPDAIPIQKNSVFGVADPKQTTALDLISQERERHVSVEGWTRESDQKHVHRELARAAAAYAIPYEYDSARRRFWPSNWDGQMWKPSPENRIKELVKAGALIAAELERLLFIQNKEA